MRRILLMVFAVAMFMGLTTTGAMAAGTKSDDGGKKCTYGKTHSGKCKPRPKECKYGKDDHGCKPKPDDCPYGKDDHGCKPKPDDCPYGKDDDDKCKPPPIVVPPPANGACAKADLVLLEDLIKDSGGLLCLYLGENAENASDTKDCPDALLALPISPIIGVCLFLPPVDVADSSPTSMPAVGAPSSGTPLTATGPLSDLVSMLTSLLKLG